MYEHLVRFSPAVISAVGAAQVEKMIHLGMRRAEAHGFTRRGPVRLYLELMLRFGCRFDTDAQYPWARSLLQPRDNRSEMQTAVRLYESASNYQTNVTTPEPASHLAKMMLRVARLTSEYASTSALATTLIHELRSVAPQRYAYSGENAFLELIHAGIGLARAHSSPSARGEALMAVLMLSCGHGCAEDPLYPWIAATLGPRGAQPTNWIDPLDASIQSWLDRN